jgi:alanyl-tRNA synthetase
MAVERGMTVDIGEFDRLMENDRKISEAAEASRKGGSTKDLTMEAEQTAWLLNSGIEITDSSLKYQRGIDLQAKVVACFQVNSF